jgi:Tfp pilus assembly protein PilF
MQVFLFFAMAKNSRKRKGRKVPAAPKKEWDGKSSPPSPSSRPGATGWRVVLLRALVIVGAGWWIYWPAIQGDWLWDDKELIRDFALIHDPDGLWRIWSDPGSMVDYYPLWSSAEWLQWRLWGDETAGYHVVNLLLHLGSALLVWRFLAKWGLRRAWVGGLIFAIHPVQVESVAWMVELKNTLSLPPFLLAMCAFLDFDERGQGRDYAQALGWFVVAMLCKTTMALFPVVILLYAWWKRGRVGGRDLKACAPFLAVSLVLGVVTLWFQQHHAIRGHEIALGGFASRVALAGSSLAFYFRQFWWPVGLLPIYPKWTIDPPSPGEFLPWIALGAMIFLCWRKRATWGRHVLLGCGFFVINLAPFLGFVPAYYMSFSWVLDHVLYIPVIGLIGLAIAGWEDVEGRQRSPAVRGLGTGIVMVVAALMAWESHGYAGRFADEESLWTYTLERNPAAWPAHNNLGTLRLREGRFKEAMEQFQEVLRIYPQLEEAHNNLGNALLQLGRRPEAIEQYEAAIHLNPSYSSPRFNLAAALTQAGRIPEAMAQYRALLEVDPNDAESHQYLGELLLHSGRAAEAAEQFGAALRNDPHYADWQRRLQEPKAEGTGSGK